MNTTNTDVNKMIAIPEYWQICVSHYVNVRDNSLEKFLITMQTMNMTVREVPGTRRGAYVIYQWIEPRYEENESYLTAAWLREFKAGNSVSAHVLADTRAVPVVQKLHFSGMIDIYRPFNQAVPDAYSRNILFSLAVNDKSYQSEYAGAITFNPDFSLAYHDALAPDESKETDAFMRSGGVSPKWKLNFFRQVYDAV